MTRTTLHHLLRLSIIAVVLSWGMAAAPPARAQLCLDSCYFTRAELYDFIFQLEANDTRGIVRIDSIGHSRGDMLGEVYPIYAVKISDNVDVFEDEPTVLIIGHIHAEEVIGMQVMAAYLSEITSARYPLYRSMIERTQLYFIPTMNPDGLEVISRCLDQTWRKNGYVPPELNGRECNIRVGEGRDSCGVDPNRNFDINWIYGDTLWDPAANEAFDYFRGPAPFSEPEAQAVAEFAMRIKPTVSIVYHSSRTGNVADQTIVAWKWGGDSELQKFPPDCTAIGLLNYRYSQRIENVSTPGDDRSLPVFGGTHNGCTQDWFYQKLGTIQITTELGPGVNIQPACSTTVADTKDLFDLIRLFMPSLNWMCRRAVNVSDNDGITPLNIHTVDDVTNLPISAEYRNLNTWTPVIGPWYTNEEWGRATILPMPGHITIMARKEGYVPDTVSTTVNPNDAFPQEIELRLQPLPWHQLTLYIKDSSGNPLAGSVYLDCDYPKWVNVPAEGTTVSLPEGSYRVMAVAQADGWTVLWHDLYLGGAATEDFWLPAAQQVFAEDFQTLDNWTVGGTGSQWRLDADTTAMGFGTSLYTNPTGHLPLYSNTADTWIAATSSVEVADGNVCYLDFYRRGRLDVPADSFFVDVSTDGSNWQQAAGFCDFEIPWTRTFVDLTPWTPGFIYVRFRLKTDAGLRELGIHVDRVRIYKGTDLNAPQEPSAIAYTYRMTGAYPNPFNPTTTVTYEVERPGLVTMAIYNVLGEEVRRFDIRTLTAGPQRLTWDGTTNSGIPVTSGLYLVRMESPQVVASRKLLLLR